MLKSSILVSHYYLWSFFLYLLLLFFKFIQTNPLLHWSLPIVAVILIQLRLYDILEDILNYLAPLASHSNSLQNNNLTPKWPQVFFPPIPVIKLLEEKKTHTFESFIVTTNSLLRATSGPLPLTTNPSMIYIVLP